MALIDALKKICSQSIRSAGARYTPGLNEAAPNLKIVELEHALEGLICGSETRNREIKLAEKIEEAYSDLCPPTAPRWRRIKKPKSLLRNLNLLSRAPIGKAEGIVAKLEDELNSNGHLTQNLNKVLDDKEAVLRAQTSPAQPEGSPDSDNENEIRAIDNIRYYLRRYRRTLEDLRRHIESPECKLHINNKALLLGQWGAGKTHFLADLSKRFLNQGIPVLFLLAKDFVPEPDLATATNKVCLIAPDFEDLIKALVQEARTSKTRALIVVDGINEADAAAWKRSIDSFLKHFEDNHLVGLVLSCRTPFQDTTFHKKTIKKFVQLFHDGFTEIEFDAQTEFFSFYKIPLPEVPLLSEEFSRPLTLKILCEAFNELPKKDRKKGFTGLASGQKGMTFILETFINSRARGIEDEIGIPPKSCWKIIKGDNSVQPPTSSGLAPAMAETLEEFVTKKKCLSIIKGRHSDLKKKNVNRLFQAMIREGIIVEDAVWRPSAQGGSEKIVRLPYQRFSDHIIARHLLEQYLDTRSARTIRRSFYKNAPLGRIFETIHPQHPTYKKAGWVEALIVEFPERVKKALPKDERELFFYLPESSRSIDSYFYPFVNGLFWRSPEAICKQTDRFVAPVLGGYSTPARDELFEALLSIGTKADHPYSGSRLFSNLERMKMADRDLLWSEFVRRRGSASVIERLLKWCERTALTNLSYERALNITSLLSLLLTTTDRSIRDRATRALVIIGELNPKALFVHTSRCLPFSDIYVPERLLASCYGVAMALFASPKRNDLKPLLLKLSQFLIKEMANRNGKFRTPHVLCRDYATGIIEITKILYPKERFSALSADSLKNPFRPVRSIKDKDFADAERAIHMDFGNYTIGHLIPNRRNYDSQHPKYKEIVRKIQCRIVELGFDYQRFKQIDDELSNRNFRSSQNNGSKVDRYGKKYSWIAYFEMYGLLEAQGKLDKEYKSKFERLSDCDIDPSFPKKTPGWNPPLNDCFQHSPTEPSDWLMDGPIPDYSSFLVLSELQGITGPWVLLDGYIRQVGTYQREAFTLVRGAFIDIKDLPKLRRRLKAKKSREQEFPEAGGDYYTFAGEVPWSLHFAANRRDTHGRLIKVKEEAFAKQRRKETRRKVKKAWRLLLKDLGSIPRFPLFTDISRDGRPTNEAEDKRIVKAIERANKQVERRERIGSSDLFHNVPSPSEVRSGFQVVSEFEHVRGIEVEIPVWHHTWESYHSSSNDFTGFMFPAPQLAKRLKLTAHSRQVELVDANGAQATLFRKSDGNTTPSFHFLYLRADLLNKYLKRSHLELLWNIWGERRLDVGLMESAGGNDSFDQIYENYLQTYRQLFKYKKDAGSGENNTANARAVFLQ